MTIYSIVDMSNRMKEKINVPRLREFIREFSDNIRREFLVEGYVPQSASDWTVDPVSYT